MPHKTQEAHSVTIPSSVELTHFSSKRCSARCSPRQQSTGPNARKNSPTALLPANPKENSGYKKDSDQTIPSELHQFVNHANKKTQSRFFPTENRDTDPPLLNMNPNIHTVPGQPTQQKSNAVPRKHQLSASPLGPYISAGAGDV